MKKVTLILLSLILSFSLLAANAFAAPPSGKGKSAGDPSKLTEERKTGLHRAYENTEGTPAQAVIAHLIEQQYSLEEMIASLEELSNDLEDGDTEDPANEEEITEGSETAEGEEVTEESDAIEDETVTEDSDAIEDETATEDSDAIEDEAATEDSDAPAVDTSAIKLKKAELKALADALRDEIKLQKESLKLSAKSLADLAAAYEKSGSIEDAADMQEESVLADIKNIESYNKLSKLYEKMGQTGVKAFVNGVQPEFDVPPVIKNGRTLLPFRAISEALGAEVAYDAEEQSVTVTKDGVEVKLFIGSNIAYVNGTEVTLDVEPVVVNGRTIVPVRFISEAFNSVVEWDAETETVIIYDEQLDDSSSEEQTVTE
jgi:hypothetical protein